MGGHSRIGHYQLNFSGKRLAKPKRPLDLRGVVFRESRCPGCHGRVTLRYLKEKVGDSYKFHLLSPSIAHPLCENALERIRELGEAAFRRAINAEVKVRKAPKVYRREKPQV